MPYAPPSHLAQRVLTWPRWLKRLLVLGLDIGLCGLATSLAFELRLDIWIFPWLAQPWPVCWAWLLSVLLALPLFITHGFYRVVFRYSGLSTLRFMAPALAWYGVLYALFILACGVWNFNMPRSIGMIQPLLLATLVGGSRAVARYWLGGLYQHERQKAFHSRVLIYGAGQSGQALALALAHHPQLRMMGFLEDDVHLQGQFINGWPVYPPAQLLNRVRTLGITHVLLALPSVSRQKRQAILSHIREARVCVRTLPHLAQLAPSPSPSPSPNSALATRTSAQTAPLNLVSWSDIQELDVDDLLGREPVAPDIELLKRPIQDQVVLVTGAGGSIGSELCRQILALGPRTLLLVDHSESALYHIHQELEKSGAHSHSVRLIPLLVNVQDAPRLEVICQTWRPHTIYHAAAYKHVPLVEHNPVQGIRNNVLGTLYIAQAAQRSGVDAFVLISTDKAVRPTNIMGASKRLAEMVLQALAEESKGQSFKTQFTMVRFGNVLDSSGSVVPKFRQQIAAGGPITLTHPDVTRYFMTIPEAAQLVIQAGAMAQGGDVFLLDMGQPVRIVDLARQMVELSGLSIRDEKNPQGDIPIQIVGLRPGEKLYEELLIGDQPQTTFHPRIMKAHESFLPWPALEIVLKDLKEALGQNDIARLRALLSTHVSGYTPSEKIVDWVCHEAEAEADKGEGAVLGKTAFVTSVTQP
jgi:FlaA1/EpsC-like NDP-sugar epimerase